MKACCSDMVMCVMKPPRWLENAFKKIFECICFRKIQRACLKGQKGRKGKKDGKLLLSDPETSVVCKAEKRKQHSKKLELFVIMMMIIMVLLILRLIFKAISRIRTSLSTFLLCNAIFTFKHSKSFTQIEPELRI